MSNITTCQFCCEVTSEDSHILCSRCENKVHVDCIKDRLGCDSFARVKCNGCGIYQHVEKSDLVNDNDDDSPKEFMLKFQREMLVNLGLKQRDLKRLDKAQKKIRDGKMTERDLEYLRVMGYE